MSSPFLENNSYEELLRKNKGIIDFDIKVSIRGKEALSIVYTPGVATPCLEIQKDLSRSYELTHKGNSILVLTDSSSMSSNKNWINDAVMPYLESFVAYYKIFGNIDSYPIILDKSLITDAEILLDTVNAISLPYHGIELSFIDNERMKKFNELYEKSTYKNKFAYIDVSDKREIDEIIKKKNKDFNCNIILSCIWRAVLDTYCTNNIRPILDFVIEEIKNDKINLQNTDKFIENYIKILECVTDYIFNNKLENHSLEKYNWRNEKLTKEYVIKKYKYFQIYGESSWVEPLPKNYYMTNHNNGENSVMLNYRYKGSIKIGLKVNLKDPIYINNYMTWENLDKISQKIIDNPKEVYELTMKNNYGSVITNGTAVLGLGDIGALAGLPVMEGKSILFKYFGGTNIATICIQELNVDKMVTYIRRIAPSFCIINLEDISGPSCFEIEEKCQEKIDYPIFHDDQHGTAVIVLAGILNATKLRKTENKDELKIVINGAGAAGYSVFKLLKYYGYKHLIVCDKAGIIYKGRKERMNQYKEIIANETNEDSFKGSLSDAMKGADIVIGLSSPNVISQDYVKSMKEKPIIFALANPIPEIFPDKAYEAGAFIVATGRSDYPNQINNSLAFPGIFRGAVDTKADRITLEMKIAAAYAIANMIPTDKLRPDFVMPNALDVNISINVAVEVAKIAIQNKNARSQNDNIDVLKENIHSYFIDNTLFL